MRSIRAACIFCLLCLAGLLPVGASAATRTGPAPAEAQLDLVLPLVADDGGLQAFVHRVSTPGSPQFGHYLPVPVLARRFGATPAVRTQALRFLRAAGASQVRINPTGMFAEARMSVAVAQRTFGVRLSSFRSGLERFLAPVTRGQASTAAVRLPAGLQGVALGVVGLDTQRMMRGRNPLPSRRARHRAGARAHQSAGQPSSEAPLTGSPRGCRGALGAQGFTPNQYLTAYGYDPLRAAGLRGQGRRVALIEIDGFRYSDLRTFAGCFGLDIPRLATFYVGSDRALPAGPETTLDLEVLDAVAPDLDSIQIYENSGNASDVVKSIVLPLITPGAKPEVVSASLGLCEPYMLQGFGRSGITEIERDVELAAATGISVLAASGDQGSAACTDDQGEPTGGLAVNYPASSPYITAVGGTNIALNADNSLAGQIVWNDTSDQPGAAAGGGLSTVFGRPGYQSAFSGLTRRAIPDVSMLADLAPGYAIYCTAPDCVAGGRPAWSTVGGTSAAAPLLAGGAALVDQDLYRHGRVFLGFMNPLLYAIGTNRVPGVFADVTEFSNDVGPYVSSIGHPLGCCSAATGFDPASGWGSVNLDAFDRVAEAVLPQAPYIAVAIPGGQHPLRQRGLKVRLYCSGPCTAEAFAVITLGSSSDFTVSAGRQRFARRGTKVLTLRFSAGRMRRLRRALAHHQRVDAEAFGIEYFSDGSVARFTAGRAVGIRS